MRRQQEQRRWQVGTDPAVRPRSTSTTARLVASRVTYRQTFTAKGYVQQHPSGSRHTKHGHASFIIATGPLRYLVASNQDRNPRHALHLTVGRETTFRVQPIPAVSPERQEQQGQRELNRIAAPTGHGLVAHRRPVRNRCISRNPKLTIRDDVEVNVSLRGSDHLRQRARSVSFSAADFHDVQSGSSKPIDAGCGRGSQAR